MSLLLELKALMMAAFACDDSIRGHHRGRFGMDDFVVAEEFIIKGRCKKIVNFGWIE